MTGLSSLLTYFKLRLAPYNWEIDVTTNAQALKHLKLLNLNHSLVEAKRNMALKKILKLEEFKLFTYKAYPIRAKINLKPGLRDV